MKKQSFWQLVKENLGDRKSSLKALYEALLFMLIVVGFALAVATFLYFIGDKFPLKAPF
jgi:carbon starvation protein CstA